MQREILYPPQHLIMTFPQDQDTCREGMLDCFSEFLQVVLVAEVISITLSMAKSNEHCHIHVIERRSIRKASIAMLPGIHATTKVQSPKSMPEPYP